MTTATLPAFDVPTRDDVSPENAALFDALHAKLGFVPNLYATFALSDHALAAYLALQGAKSSIAGRAREVVNLVVSQFNGCEYCLAAHTVLGRMHGFSDAQILEIRSGRASFDPKLDVLARIARSIAADRGHVSPDLLAAFLEAGWSRGHLVDTIVAVGDKTISNYLHAATAVPIDFPRAPALAGAPAGSPP